MKLVADVILIVGMVLNSIALIGLFRIQHRELPQRILIFFWFFILGVILNFYAALHKLNTLRFITYFLEDGARFIVPVLIYIYIKSIFQEKSGLLKKNLFHFIPFALYLAIYTVPKSVKAYYPFIYQIDEHVNRALIKDVYGIIYLLLSIKLYYRVHKSMKQSFSNLTTKDFLWLEKFLVCFLIVLVIDLLLTISEISFGYSVTWDGYVTVIFMIVAMAYIGYYGLTQSTIFLPSFLVPEYTSGQEEEKQKQYLNQRQKEALTKKFNELMDQEKLYVLQELSLRTLSERMEVSERMLSAFFNEVLNSNFYDCINSYRVNEAKKRLKSSDIKFYTIAAIGLSSGFNSKSSFYRVFKKTTGLSPSDYRKGV